MKNLFLFSAFCFLGMYLATAQDVIYLNNGSIIKGAIKQADAKITRMDTDNGSTFFVVAKDIKKVDRNVDANKANNIFLPSNKQLDTKNPKKPVGSVCFINPNSYPREIILTHKETGKKESLLVSLANYGKTTSGCLYDIPAGVYDCVVYTTYSKKQIEQFNIRVTAQKETQQMLGKNHYN